MLPRNAVVKTALPCADLQRTALRRKVYRFLQAVRGEAYHR
jgi:hypothetical protein